MPPSKAELEQELAGLRNVLFRIDRLRQPSVEFPAEDDPRYEANAGGEPTPHFSIDGVGEGPNFASDSPLLLGEWADLPQGSAISVSTEAIGVEAPAHRVARFLHPREWARHMGNVKVTELNEDSFVETISARGLPGTSVSTRLGYDLTTGPCGGVLDFWWMESVKPSPLVTMDEGAIVVRERELADPARSLISVTKRLRIDPQALNNPKSAPVVGLLSPAIVKAMLEWYLRYFAVSVALELTKEGDPPGKEVEAQPVAKVAAASAWSQSE